MGYAWRVSQLFGTGAITLANVCATCIAWDDIHVPHMMLSDYVAHPKAAPIANVWWTVYILLHLPFELRLKCMLATVEYQHDPKYAEYIEPARELCMRNLRDPIPIAAEQLGEALGFVTMAQALRICGGERQARQGHSSYWPLGEMRAFSPAPHGA